VRSLDPQVKDAFAVATGQTAANRVIQVAVTGADGSYVLRNLLAGKYTVGVQKRGGPHLNS
jgi:hypothetical protein